MAKQFFFFVYKVLIKYRPALLLLNVYFSSYCSWIAMLHVSALEQELESLKAYLVTLQIKLATSVPTVIIAPVVPVVEPYSYGQWLVGILIVGLAIAFVCYFKGSSPDDSSPDLGLSVEKPVATVEVSPLPELLGKDTGTVVPLGQIVPLGFRFTHPSKKNLDIFDLSESALDWDWDYPG
jgi:hypothetical protein